MTREDRCRAAVANISVALGGAVCFEIDGVNFMEAVKLDDPVEACRLMAGACPHGAIRVGGVDIVGLAQDALT